MRREKLEQEKKTVKNSNDAGTIIGSILRSIVIFFGIIFRFLFKLFSFFGLWVPIAYALFGTVLFLFWDFNPFLLDTYGIVYLCGAIACVVCSAVVSVKNLIVKPVKSVARGYRHPIWEKGREEKLAKEREMERLAGKWETVKQYKKERVFHPPEIEVYDEPEREELPEFLLPLDDFMGKTEREKEASRNSVKADWLPKRENLEPQTVKTRAVPQEKPQVYFSKLEPNVLVHEYSDRFELYRMVGKNLISEGVEYK